MFLLRAVADQRAGRWAEFRDDVTAALAAAGENDESAAWAAAFGVAGLLVARPPQSLWAPDRADMVVARGWHDDLHTRLQRLADREKRGRESLSFFPRAVELVGFDLFADEAAGQTLGSAIGPMPLRIPAGLREDVIAIERQLLQALDLSTLDDNAYNRCDRVSGRVFRKLFDPVAGVADRLKPHLQRDLVNAPIWASRELDVETIKNLIANRKARRAAEDGYRILMRVAGPQQRFGAFRSDLDDLERATSHFDQASQMLSVDSAATRRAVYIMRMEACYCRLLVANLFEENKTAHAPLLAGLQRRYVEITQDFPESSIPYFRLNVIEPNKHVERQREFLSNALDLLENGLDQLAPDHWVRSTMVRRRVVLDVRSILELRASAQSDAVAARRYREAPQLLKFEAAIRDLRSGFKEEAAHDDFLTGLEHQRRLNNIVYLAVLAHEFDPDEGLAKVGLDADRLRVMVSRLQQRRASLMEDGADSITRLSDRDIVHTIGFAYMRLGDRKLAAKAGDRLRRLAFDHPMPDDYKLLSDARQWGPSDGEQSGAGARHFELDERQSVTPLPAHSHIAASPQQTVA